MFFKENGLKKKVIYISVFKNLGKHNVLFLSREYGCKLVTYY